MLHSVALVIVDIVKSRTIHARLREEVGSKADGHYTKNIYAPFRRRVDALLAAHDGRLDNDTGDQIAAFFDHTQDAILFALNLQKQMAADPIAVPGNCGCPHLQLHAAVGCGTMETAAYEKPGSVKVGAFNDLARILGVTADGQILITPEARESAGRIAGATWQEWDVVLPKEEDRVKVLEILWDGHEPQRPKDMAGVTQTAMALASQNKHLTEENASLKADLTAALERVQARADTGDPQALAAIDQARKTGDLTQLDAALDAEWERREKQLKDQFRDMLELSRESAAVAFMHGDIDKAISRAQTILRIAPDDLDAINLLGKVYELRGDLPAAEQQFKRELQAAGDEPSQQSRPPRPPRLDRPDPRQHGGSRETLQRSTGDRPQTRPA
jgi:class 3 adenylate cyclase